MATAGIQALMVLSGAGPAAARSESASVLSDDTPSSQQFAQLLSDSGTQGEHAASEHLLKGQLAAAANASAVLAAQELGDADATAAISQLVMDADHAIDAEQATALITKIDAWLHSRDGDASQENSRGQVMEVLAQFEGLAGAEGKQAEAKDVLDQLRQQLQGIRDSGEPKKLSDILAAMPAVAVSKALMAGLANLLLPARENKKTEEAPAPTTANAIASLPATLFRADDGEAAAAASAAPRGQEKDALSLGMDAPVTAVVYQPLVSIQEVAMATENAPIRIRSDLDQAVPPLTLNDTNSDALPSIDALPLIDLPVVGARDVASATANTTATTTPATTHSAAATATNSPAATHSAAATAIAALTPEASKSLKVNDVAPADAIAASNDFSALVGNLPASTQQTQTARAPAPVFDVPVMPQAMNRAPVSEQVQVAISQASKDGLSRITIQLDPIDLGRVEVSMVTQADGRSQISFMVDKVETFDGLSRDARMLERSLQEAGIKADAGSMQFNLRQQPQPQMQSDAGGQNPSGQSGRTPQEEQQTQRSVETLPVAAFTRNYTVNIRDGVDISA